MILAGIAILVAGCSQDRPRVNSELGDYHPPGTGPFDSRGTYVESWADKPSRWRGRSVPRPPSSLQREVAQTTSQAEEIPQPVAPIPKPATRQPSTPQQSAIAAKIPPPAKVSTPVPPKTAPKPAAKPQPVKVTPKKPAPSRVTVKKGDTLYGLSLRHKCSVAAIKKANSLKGDMIKPGQKLVMPR